MAWFFLNWDNQAIRKRSNALKKIKLKILRPIKESNSVLSTNGKYRPQKTEKQKVIADPFFARETALRDLAAEIKCDKGVSFNQIKSCKKDATISSVFVFCTSMSRCIKGNYGDYR